MNIKFKNEQCSRNISILEYTFSSNLIKSKVYLFVHPNFNKLEETQLMENCLISAAKYYDQISILPIHSFMNKKWVEFGYQDLYSKEIATILPKASIYF